MNLRLLLAPVLLSIVLAACDGGGGLREDTGVCSTRPTSFGTRGELTAFPSIETSITGANLGLRSVNFVAVPAVGEYLPYIEVFAEVENTGSSRLCAAIFDVSLGGFSQEAVLHGPQNLLPTIDISWPCVEPGGRGVIRAIIHRATEEDLLNAYTLRIDRSNDPIEDMGEAPYDLTTLSDQRIVEADGGYRLVQTVTAERDVLNYFQDVYAIDSRGLLIAELDVPSYGPTSGGASLSAGIPAELESDVLPCEFVEFFVASENYFE